MHTANDNQPKRHLVGIGNAPWRVNDEFGELSPAEVMTASLPLRQLHEMVVQSVELIRTDPTGVQNYSVYVIGDVMGRQCKIGKAANPVSRLAQLQTGNPNLLFLHRVFWMRRVVADRVEVTAHRIAGNRYTRLQGEWFECSPDQAHTAIEESIHHAGVTKSYCAMTPLQHLMEVAA